MKDTINEKVKHRQWFRPFAPAILSEETKNWFEKDVNSPYMSFAIPFKKEVRDKVEAVVHFDGTGRLQTVSKNDNKVILRQKINTDRCFCCMKNLLMIPKSLKLRRAKKKDKKKNNQFYKSLFF